MPLSEYKTRILAIDKDWLPYIAEIESGDRKMPKSGEQVEHSRAMVGDKRAARGAAVMRIRGPLFNFSYEAIGESLHELMKNPDIATIIMRFESPGGVVTGAPELADYIFEAGKDKRIVAVADPYAFSAAYYLASAATELYLTPSGQVGSVGVYVMHVDQSKLLDDMGIKVTFVKAGEKKVDANPFEPLSDSAKTDLQEEVDHYYQEFVGDVARFRGVSKEFVIEHFGAGGRVLSDRALSKGMIDGILSYKEVLAREIELLEDQSQAAIAKDFMVRTKLFLELEKC